MIVIGIDPGTIVTGFGIVEQRNGTMKLLGAGAVRNSPSDPMPVRLKRIHDALRETMSAYRPEACAIETAFYGKNAQSALKLGHARGVAMLAAVERRIETSEYSPREVKKAVAGRGNASKQQVQFMVNSLLRLPDSKRPYDVTDAIAVAVCHLHRTSAPQRPASSWKAFVAAHPERVVSRKKPA